MEKRGAISPLFHNIFNMSLTSGVKFHIDLLNVVVRFIVFLTSATLIARGTDISKCFRDYLGIRDNESRLYIIPHFFFRRLEKTVLCDCGLYWITTFFYLFSINILINTSTPTSQLRLLML